MVTYINKNFAIRWVVQSQHWHQGKINTPESLNR